MKKEIWKDIITWHKGKKYDYTGLYQVSDMGNVRSLDTVKIITRCNKKYKRKFYGKILAPIKIKANYRYINLTKNGEMKSFYIHHLVLNAFVGKRPKGLFCKHKNKINHDNRLENLSWDEWQARDTSSKKASREQIAQIKDLLCDGIKPSIIANYTGASIHIIRRIRHNAECPYQKAVPWPNKPKNFWRQLSYTEHGLKSPCKVYKLSKQDIIDIKELIYRSRKTMDLDLTTIADLYNVDLSLISKINNNKRYKNVGRKL